MLRRFASLFLALILTVSLFSCDPAGENADSATPPARVAVLFSSLCEVWQAVGGSVAVTVGESVERGLVPDGTPLVDEGAGKSINTELLLAARPDLVIYSPDIPAQVNAAALCEVAGIDTLPLRIETFPDYVQAIETAAAITGDTRAIAETAALNGEIEAIRAAAPGEGMRVLFIRAGSSASSTKAKTSADHFAAAMLSELGCRNIADEAPILIDTLSTEAILEANPDRIFFSLMGNEEAARANVAALLARPEWQALDAVRFGRVTILPRALFHYKPCGRYAEAYDFLANALNED